ncbi:MAG: hypothetical protein RLZZ148_2369 [Cyanobacteriota bacterium]
MAADVYKKQRKFASAIEAIKTALEINPKFLLGHIRLGRIYLQQRNNVAAKKAFQIATELNPIATELNPSSVEAKVGLSEALIQSNELKLANQIIQELPKLREKFTIGKQLFDNGEEVSLSETINASSNLDIVLYFYSLEQQQRYLSE